MFPDGGEKQAVCLSRVITGGKDNVSRTKECLSHRNVHRYLVCLYFIIYVNGVCLLAVSHRRQKGGSDSLEAEVTSSGEHPDRGAGTELRFSGRPLLAVNHGAFSRASFTYRDKEIVQLFTSLLYLAPVNISYYIVVN